MIYPTEFPSLKQLISNPKASILLKDKAFPAVLTFNSEKSVAGACKLAYFGQTDKQLFSHSSCLDVCIKQAFYIDRVTAAQRVYDGPKQGEILTVEINCLRWASALMHIVYEFMEREDTNRGTKPSFPIPQMRYVNVMLAVANNLNHDTYLVEEVVDESDGKFLKYINNTASTVLPQTDDKRKYIGNFLSFAQHVQFLETNEQVFVSDQQGTFSND
jgi:hypothetical protein